mmetsp:Transcript_23139/g.58130  ORF Transcript_23139/g.58130 Transcript_23139/m.58130 type:complete len:117 (+) Transcript_23139:286-636(+)
MPQEAPQPARSQRLHAEDTYRGAILGGGQRRDERILDGGGCGACPGAMHFYKQTWQAAQRQDQTRHCGGYGELTIHRAATSCHAHWEEERMLGDCRLCRACGGFGVDKPPDGQEAD